ncbi:Uncharacterised protein [Mycobacteroides abscessus subsp. abscessus]|nr:Uncharacterised protein [Mycobacteroides abscessus subsp. abscessus]
MRSSMALPLMAWVRWVCSRVPSACSATETLRPVAPRSTTATVP